MGEDQDDEKTHALHRLQNPDVPRTTLAALMGPGNTAPKPTDLERLKKAWSTASPDAREQFISWLSSQSWRHSRCVQAKRRWLTGMRNWGD